MSDKNNFVNAVTSLTDGVDTFLSTKTVVGEPTQVGDTIIVPLVDVSFGVAAGSYGKDSTGSAGGGVNGKMTPSAVLVIHNGHTKLVNIKNQNAVTKVIDMIPDIIDKITEPKNKDVTEDEAVEIAFGEDED